MERANKQVLNNAVYSIYGVCLMQQQAVISRPLFYDIYIIIIIRGREITIYKYIRYRGHEQAVNTVSHGQIIKCLWIKLHNAII